MLTTTAHKPRVIAITAGKGGVGKSNIAVNLAIALAQQTQRVMLLDASLGLANIDVLLGLTPRYDIADVIAGRCTLKDTLLKGPAGIEIIPAATGQKALTELQALSHSGLVHAFNEFNHDLHTLIIDTAAGISSTVIDFTRAAHEVIVVVCNEPTSITDAYALIKVLSQDFGVNRFHVLSNRVETAAEGRELFAKVNAITENFLDVVLNYLGAIPEDACLKEAVKAQAAVVTQHPESPATRAFQQIAAKIQTWPREREIPAGETFFLEQYLQQTTVG